MSQYKCSECGEEQKADGVNECDHEGCEETEHGIHMWVPVDVEQAGSSTKDENEEESDDWRTMHSDEVKRQNGLKQVNGVLWERSN